MIARKLSNTIAGDNFEAQTNKLKLVELER